MTSSAGLGAATGEPRPSGARVWLSGARRDLGVAVLLGVSFLAGCRCGAEPRRAGREAASTPGTAPSDVMPLELVPSAASSAGPSGGPSAAPPASPSTWSRPFFYRLTSGPKASYLLGTMHLPDRRLAVLPPAVEAAMVACDAFYGELPLDAKTQAELARGFMLPGGAKLSSVLPPALHARVEREWSSRSLPFAPFDGMKPWVVSVQITLLDRFMELATHKPLDSALYARAEADGKEVGGLETAAEQLAVFDELARAEQVTMLKDTLDQLDRYREARRDPLGELVEAYVSGEDARVVRAMEEDFDPNDPLDVKIRQRLFTDRNARLADRILVKLRGTPGRGYLFAVGAGHVVGDDGLLVRLSHQGYSPVRAVE